MVGEENTFITFSDEICANLDTAMMVRRTGISGNATPTGILTEYTQSHIGNIIKRIEFEARAATIDFGLLILTFSKDTIRNLNKGIEIICSKAEADGQQHVWTISIANSGLTIHSSYAPIEEATKLLRRHCELRKYSFKAPTWFGILFSPAPSFALKSAIKLDYVYEYSPVMKEMISKILKPARS